MKRSMIVVGLLSLFLVVTLSIAACGISAEDATSNLGNAIGGENGPGSGNWSPNKPTNQRQARLLNETLINLLDGIVANGTKHTQMILICYDGEGNRIETDNELCKQPIVELEETVRLQLDDFRAGYDVYTTCCPDQEFPEIELPKTIGSFPFILDNGIPTIILPLGVEDDEPKGWWHGTLCCLTCVQNFENPEYAFIDLDVDASSFASQ